MLETCLSDVTNAFSPSTDYVFLLHVFIWTFHIILLWMIVQVSLAYLSQHYKRDCDTMEQKWREIRFLQTFVFGGRSFRWVVCKFDNMAAFGFALCFAKQTKIVKDTLLRKATGVRDGNLQLKTAPLAKTFAKLI